MPWASEWEASAFNQLASFSGELATGAGAAGAASAAGVAAPAPATARWLDAEILGLAAEQPGSSSEIQLDQLLIQPRRDCWSRQRQHYNHFLGQ